jgi:hypothetical protein
MPVTHADVLNPDLQSFSLIVLMTSARCEEVRLSKPCHLPVLSTLVMALRSAAVTPRPYFTLTLI